MRKKTILLESLSLALIFVGLIGCSTRKEVQPTVIEVESLLDLSSLKPNIDPSTFMHFYNTLAFDKANNLYILDSVQHRVLKFTLMGKFLMQIGSIGQEDQDLFNPCGIFIYNENLYIIDGYNEKQRIKKFSLMGQYESIISLPESSLTKSFFISSDKLFVNEVNDWDKPKKLISIYSLVGKKQQEIGNKNPFRGKAANDIFNSVYLSTDGKNIYGCFKFTPIYFRFPLDSNEEPLYKNLEYDEIKKITMEGKKRGADTLESVRSAKNEVKRIACMNYCYGFATDDKKNVLYSVNYDLGKKGVILRMDVNGNLREKIILKLGNFFVEVFHLYYSSNFYAVVLGDQGRLHLVKFKI